MFRVSRRVDYGLKLLVALAADQQSGSQATSKLASRLDIPLAFLHQIGRSLIQAGILRSTPGPGGGLRLNQTPEDISLLQVLEVLDGPVCLSECLEDGATENPNAYPYHQAWASIQQRLVEELSSVKISNLAKESLLVKDNRGYPIQGYKLQKGPVSVN
jgi:Rrf2 family protein